ncbi:hypothetical protein DFP72DRAFT_895193 [Ephemerocybe angulata]|uniref:F-box domain-containing protein n=1 Tax=Ephemerocybe angulata TaxID=980116 RepID=A0A8H6I0N0_9AGAR|nr:hypothetical protein DFP72DRAFT_895193 [Tulosesus angulatus]
MSTSKETVNMGATQSVTVPPVSDATKTCLEEGRNTGTRAFLEKIKQRLVELDHELPVPPPEALLRLAYEIRLLKENQNALSPACRIPPELLARIFTLLLKPMTIDGWSMTRQHPVIPLSHVCRDWRATSLQCASLWSNLSYLTPRTMELAFSRSGTAPLEIAFVPGRHLFTDVHRKALSQTERLLSVELYSAPNHTFRAFVSFLSEGAPILEKLSLKCGPNTGQPQHREPDVFLQGGAPSLRRLELVQTGIPWSKLPVSAHLTHLIIDEWDTLALRPEMDEVVAFLKQTPVLQYLDLSSIIPYNMGYGGAGRHQVRLQALQEMRLQDDSNNIFYFLSYLQIPVNTKTKVIFTDELDEFGIDIEAIGLSIAALKASWIRDGNPRSRMVTKFEFSGSFFDEDDDNFQGEPLLSAGFWMGDNQGPGLVITLARDESVSVHELLSTFSKSIDFSSLQSFTLADSGAPSQDRTLALPCQAWMTIFGPLTSLKTIKLERSWPRGFIPALHPADGGSAYFPALSTIIFEGVDWFAAQLERDGNGRKSRIELAGWLGSVLHDRSESRAIELRFEDCYGFKGKDYGMIRAISPRLHVEWDGCHGYCHIHGSYHNGQSDSEEDEDYDEEGEEEDEEEG